MSALRGANWAKKPLQWVILLIWFVGGCIKQDGETEGRSANQPVSEAEESVAIATERVLAGEAEDADWEQALSEDPRGLHKTISAIYENDDSHGWTIMGGFFQHLSKVDPDLARDLLPEEMNLNEQRYWLGVIAQGYIATGDPKGAAELLNARYRGEGLFSAINSSLRGASFDDSLAFWNALKDGDAKDGAIDILASKIAKTSIKDATEWYGNLEDHLKPNAVESIAYASSDIEEIRQQLALTDDAPLREKLANTFGKRLTQDAQWEVFDPIDAAARLSTLPEELVVVAEVEFINQFVTEAGGNVANVDSVRAYLPETITQEGRDLAHRIIASDEFSRDPERGISMLMETGLDKKNPDIWERHIGQWLRIDGMAASEYISKLPQSPSQQIAVKETIGYLRDVGDSEAAQAWRELLVPEESPE